MKILRTPDERFTNLPDYPFAPHYVEVPTGDGSSDRIRVHYVDEGSGPVVLLLHGEPSWSYLYRNMVPPLVDDSRRVIVPDLVGFGRSDKPADPDDYTYERMVAWMEAALIDQLNLRDITLFCQDWGGLIGLRLVAAHPERFARVMVSNTGLPTGKGTPPQAFLDWQAFSRTADPFPTAEIIQGATLRELGDAELAAYEAPFPDETYKAGARRLPSLVPTSESDPSHDAQVRAWESLAAFDKPFITAFSDSDPVTAGGQAVFQRKVRGAEGVAHVTILDAGHFLQEDQPDKLVTQLCDFMSLY